MFALLAILFNGALAFGERPFNQYKGRALALGIPLYEGAPASEYPYRSLGPVAGETKGGRAMVTQRMSGALEDLATKAKAMGANAVIKIEPRAEGSTGFRYDGEAVVFETLPGDNKSKPSSKTS